MQKYIEVIQPSGETFLIRQAVASNFDDALSGEMTLSFTVKMKDLPSFSSESVLRYGGQYFRISSFVRSISSGEYLISVEAEQESFVLSDKSLDLDKFEFSGLASDALALILSETGMAGYIENDVQVEFDKAGTVTRRSLLKELVSLCGGELEYDGHNIRIVNHRGTSSRYDILAAHPTADLTVRNDVSGNTVNYKLLTDCSDGITVGDEVRLKVGGSFQIDVDVRVISVGYDIFNCAGVTVQMGDYSPDITDSIVDGDEKISDIEEALTDAVKKSDLSASIDTYILKPYKITYPVYLDSEYCERNANGRGDRISKAQRTKNALAFLSCIEKARYRGGLYCAENWFTNEIGGDEIRRAGYSIWCARLAGKPRIGKHDAWQYTWTAKVPGIIGNVDMSEFYRDFSGEGVIKSVSEVAAEVIAGKWGNGEKRKKRLIEAGYDYAAVQLAVNAMVK